VRGRRKDVAAMQLIATTIQAAHSGEETPVPWPQIIVYSCSNGSRPFRGLGSAMAGPFDPGAPSGRSMSCISRRPGG
jgi:hypothetical protein